MCFSCFSFLCFLYFFSLPTKVCRGKEVPNRTPCFVSFSCRPFCFVVHVKKIQSPFFLRMISLKKVLLRPSFISTQKMLNPFSFNFKFPLFCTRVWYIFIYFVGQIFLSALLFLGLLRFVYMSFLMFSIIETKRNKENKDMGENNVHRMVLPHHFDDSIEKTKKNYRKFNCSTNRCSSTILSWISYCKEIYHLFHYF